MWRRDSVVVFLALLMFHDATLMTEKGEGSKKKKKKIHSPLRCI